MRFNDIWHKILVRLLNNKFGRFYLGVPEGKKIYKITKSSAHYYTGEIAKNGQPIICTGEARPGGRLPFIHWLENWKPIHLCWFFDLMGWKIPKYFIGLDTGAKAPTANTSDVYFVAEWTNPANVYANEGTYATRELLDADTYGNAYYGFGFGITAGATINGIEMAVEGHYTTTGTRAAKINLYTGYIRVGANIKGQITNVGTDLPVTNDAVLTFGGATSLPATPPTAAELNDNTTAGFRILLGVERGTGTGNPTGFVDYITVKVYYTEAVASTASNLSLLGVGA